MTDTSLLGFGFHVFGRADLTSGAALAVVKTSLAEPDDNVVASPGDARTEISANTFTTREEVTAHMAASVDLSYSGAVFSGEFSAKYASESASDTQTAYGMYEVARPATITRLANLDGDALAESFATSSDVLNLPETFTPETAEQFFRIFRRFGTHIVSEVTLGGKLTAYTSAQLSSTLDAESASATMKVEYEALFSSGSAASSADWGTIDKGWATEREISFDVLGGDPSPLASFTPDYGASAGDLVSAWLASVAAAPAVVGFQLAPLSVVFDGPVASAVDQAIAAYLTALIRVEAWEYYYPLPNGPYEAVPAKASTITLPGQLPQSQPATFWGAPGEASAMPPQPWVWIALLNPDAPSFSDPQCLNQAYYLSDGVEAQIDADIATLRKTIPNPLVLVCGEFRKNLPGADGAVYGTVVPQALRNLLTECGFDIQAAMDRWQVMALVGAANSGSPTVAASTWAPGVNAPAPATGTASGTVPALVADPGPMGTFSAPSTVVAQYLDRTLTLVDVTGDLLSPVTS